MKKGFLSAVFLVLTTGLIFAQTIDITLPAGCTTWEVGTQQTIKWTKSPELTTNVKIRLLNQAGAKVLEITNGATNNGNFPWDIPSDLSPGKYMIRVRTIDNSVTDDSLLFNIVNPSASAPGSINITNPPSPNYEWMHRKGYMIKWDSSNLQSNLAVDLLNSRGTRKVKTLFSGISNSGQKIWSPPINIPAGTYRIKVFSRDGLVSDKSDPFKIVRNPKILYPPSGTNRNVSGVSLYSNTTGANTGQFTPQARPKILIVKINDRSYTPQMSVPLSNGALSCKVFFNGICTSPMEYKVVIMMSNINLGGELQHIYDSGWNNNGNFNIYVPKQKVDEVVSNPLPMWYGGEISLRIKNKSTGQTSIKKCEVKFTW